MMMSDDMMMSDETKPRDVKIKASFYMRPIRHMSIGCPYCQNWFRKNDILTDDVDYKEEIIGVKCHCPVCDLDFKIGIDSEIRDLSDSDVYENCLEKKIVWE